MDALFFQIEVLLKARERYVIQNALFIPVCHREQCNEKGAFEVCRTWSNQFPFKTIHLEQGSHTTWIPSKKTNRGLLSSKYRLTIHELEHTSP